jgi:hypothetical protein
MSQHRSEPEHGPVDVVQFSRGSTPLQGVAVISNTLSKRAPGAQTNGRS